MEEKILINYLNENKIEINNEKIKIFNNYMEYLIEYNKKINLTAITEPTEIIKKHFIDSLTINKYIKNNDKIIDVGTGAGFPGIPIKIIRENTEIKLLDSLNKRIIFLFNLINNNNLEKIEAIHGRAEEYGQNPEYRECFDVATSRAVAKMEKLIEYLIPFVKIGGICICMKGPEIEEELNQAKKHIELLGGKIEKVEEIELEFENSEKIKRNIIIIKKIKQTPMKYPRKGI